MNAEAESYARVERHADAGSSEDACVHSGGKCAEEWSYTDEHGADVVAHLGACRERIDPATWRLGEQKGQTHLPRTRQPTSEGELLGQRELICHGSVLAVVTVEDNSGSGEHAPIPGNRIGLEHGGDQETGEDQGHDRISSRFH